MSMALHAKKAGSGVLLTEAECTDGEENNSEGHEDRPRGAGDAVAEAFKRFETAKDESCAPSRHPSRAFKVQSGMCEDLSGQRAEVGSGT